MGERLFPGAVVAMIGPLGAGKTHFTRAVCEGLGVANPKVVTSPTFVLIQEYSGRLPIAHFDAYRLGSFAEFEDLGPGEYFNGPWVSLIEWADRVETVLPRDRLQVTIRVRGEHARRFEFETFGARHAELLNDLSSA